MSTEDLVMAHIAPPDDCRRRSNSAKHDRVDRVLDLALREGLTAEQRAQAIQRLALLGEMTEGIAHDFRNILAIIESGLRLAERSSNEPEKVRAFIADARAGAAEGVKLISQLVTFANEQELDARAGDVNALMKDLERLLKYCVGPEIRIVPELASDVPKCVVDPSQFNAAVLNLVINARDAMPNGGEVRISTKRCAVETAVAGSPPPGDYVRVRVKDNGQGMSEDVARRVFDPFFTTKGENGTGLGFSQISAFMRLIGGYVSVTSEQGVGTAVDLLLPTAEPDEIVPLTS
jgi:signal transduction histidine kinase